MILLALPVVAAVFIIGGLLAMALGLIVGQNTP